MAKAVEVFKPEWFTLVEDLGKANPTQFLIKPLDGCQEQDVRFRKDDVGRWGLDAASARSVLLSGLQGWKNFYDSAGEVHFNLIDREANLARLSGDQVVELASAIYARTKLSPEEIKNLSSQSTSPSKTESPSNAAPGAPGDGTATIPTQPDT